jgi:hypothetical protein
MMRLYSVLLLAILCGGCSFIADPSPAELFRLREECAEQGRKFEDAWHREFDWIRNKNDSLSFSYHYHARQGQCYVRVRYGNTEYVKVATDGTDGPNMALRSVDLKDAQSHSELVKIQSLMEDKTIE